MTIVIAALVGWLFFNLGFFAGVLFVDGGRHDPQGKEQE